MKPDETLRQVDLPLRLRHKASGWALAILALALLTPLLIACTATRNPQGWAGPVATDSMLLASVNHKQLTAYRLDNQQKVWQFPQEKQKIDNKEIDLEGIYSTPVVADGVVYLGAYDGRIYALSLDTGELRWAVETSGPIIGGILVQKGVVYVGSSDGRLYALNASSGESVWDKPFATKGSIWSTPVADGNTIYVASMDKHLYAIDMTSGQPRWPEPFLAAAGIPSDPALAHGMVLVGAMDRRFYALDAATGQVRWSVKADNWFWSKPLVEGDTIYVGALDGRVYAIDINNGKLRWPQPFRAGAAVRATPVLSRGVLVVADKDGNIYGIDPATGSQIWQDKIQGDVLADPYKTDSLVYLADGKGDLYKVEGDRGNPILLSLAK